MEIDFDALDQVISQRRPSPKLASKAALKTPKYIDVIQAGAIKRPAVARKSSSMRKVKRVVTKKVEKVEKPAANLSELIDRELESGDTTLGENLPKELNVDDLVAYAEDSGVSVDAPETSQMSAQDVAEDFLSTKHELVPFLPNIKVEKTPLSSDLPHATERSKSERELASELIKDDLVADKEEIKEKEEKKKSKEKARILTEERIPAKKPKRVGSQSVSPKKTSTGLVIMLGVLIAIFGAVAGAFVYLITAD